MASTVLLFLLIGVSLVLGDVYLHNPRGSNGRLNEANTNRNNANRLFDSQNNAKGGYCVGPAMSYFEGSYLDVEWTGSHACGNPKVLCTIVFQYMCTATNAAVNIRIRDGTTTDTISDDSAGYQATDANGDLLYGMHESYDYYQACKTRNRNQGLFIADRETEGNLNSGRPSAIFTRQNNNGNRHGFECPEERDYWPYWHPSPWKDIVVLVNDLAACPLLTSKSQNVQAKGECQDGGFPQAPNNEGACNSSGFTWVNVPAFGIAAPQCLLNQETRDNYLGNAINGKNPTYRWKLPTAASESCITTNNCNCVLRMRYNVTTAELGSYVNQMTNSIDFNKNGAVSPVLEDQIVTVDGIPFQMAVDTTQYGRISEDRSHMFHIRPRTTVPASTKIYNLSVKGKRGNDVQTYPAEQYAFTPDSLSVNSGDYIHFQWTGCDTNPAGNAGEGTDQTDRSNIVQIENAAANTPADDTWLANNAKLFANGAQRLSFAMLDQTDCLDYAELLTKNGGNENSAEQDVQNCMKLNAASQYFDGGLVQMNTAGSFWFMSSRNNNFSNRGQKGNIVVT